jgi:hypothetical protein
MSAGAIESEIAINRVREDVVVLVAGVGQLKDARRTIASSKVSDHDWRAAGR